MDKTAGRIGNDHQPKSGGLNCDEAWTLAGRRTSIIKKPVVARRQNFMGIFGFHALALLVCLGLTTQLGRAQGLPSGIFQFTTGGLTNGTGGGVPW